MLLYQVVPLLPIDACDSLSLYVRRAGFDGRGLDLSLVQKGKSFVQRRIEYIKCDGTENRGDNID